MRTVYNNNELSHVWANQKQATAKGSSMFFNNGGIYSYGHHFMIAKHLNESTILFTLRTYSNSTAKHIIKVRQAANHKTKIYCFNPDGTHQDNINFWLQQIKKEGENLIKAKKPEIYLNAIAHHKNTMQIYLDYFKLKLSKIELQSISFSDKASFIESTEKAKQAFLLENKQNLIKGKKALQKWVNNFHKNEPQNLSSIETKCLEIYRKTNGFNTYLRINGENVESSQYMKMPISVFKRYFAILNDIKVGADIMGYKVIENNKTTLILGCHSILKSELAYINSLINK
jgi:hypothetical protein